MSTNGDETSGPSEPQYGAVPPPYVPPSPVPPPYVPAAPVPPSYLPPIEAGLAGESVAFGGLPGTESVLPTSTVLPGDPPRGGGRKRWVLTGAGIVVLALLGGGGVWAYSLLSGGGAQPDTVVPSSAVAYASIDLDPSAGQKIAAARFLRQFPDLKNQVTENGDLLQELFTSVTKGDSSNKINYATDVKPWLGKRGAVAVLPPLKTGGAPRVVAAVQVTDEAKAQASIPKVIAEANAESSSDSGDSGDGSCTSDLVSAATCTSTSSDTPTPPPGVVVRDGYALIGLDQTGIETVSTEAQQSPLSKSPTFTADMKRITAPGIASAWINVGAVDTLIKNASQSLGGSDGFGGTGLAAGGRVVAGLHIEPNYVELEAQGFGAPSAPAGAAPGGPLLQKLPANTTGAVAFGNSAAAAARSAQAVKASGESLTAAGKALGLTVPDDIEALLGSRFVIAVGDVNGDTPQVGVRVDTDDPSASGAVLDTLIAKLKQPTSDGFFLGDSIPTIYRSVTTDGIAYASTQDYATLLGQDGTLGADPSFQAALPAASTADLAAYLSFDRLATAIGQPNVTRNLAPLAALGMTAHSSGTTSDLDVRLVAH